MHLSGNNFIGALKGFADKIRNFGLDADRDWHTLMGLFIILLLAMIILGFYLFGIVPVNFYDEETKVPSTTFGAVNKEGLEKTLDAYDKKAAKIKALINYPPDAPAASGGTSTSTLSGESSGIDSRSGTTTEDSEGQPFGSF